MAEEAFSAFYIYDTEEEVNAARQKMAGCDKCPAELISLLTNICRQNSPFNEILRTVQSYEQQLEQKEIAIPKLDIHFSKPSPYKPPKQGKRVPEHSYNIPTSGEVSIIMVGPNIPKHPGLILPMGSGELRFLPYTDPHSDPVCFFLLFPCGEVGWDGSWEPAKKTEQPETQNTLQSNQSNNPMKLSENNTGDIAVSLPVVQEEKEEEEEGGGWEREDYHITGTVEDEKKKDMEMKKRWMRERKRWREKQNVRNKRLEMQMNMKKMKILKLR
jgi:hypothetical protein